MESGWNTLHNNGYLGMINLPSWLFLSSFEKLRNIIVNEKHIDSLLHMGRGIFGVDWGSTSFIVKNGESKTTGHYFKLHKRNFQHLYPEDIRDIFLKSLEDTLVKIDYDKYRDGKGVSSIGNLISTKGLKVFYRTNQKDFSKIPGSPIGYWLSRNFLNLIDNNNLLGDVGSGKQGLATADNNRFLRYWVENNYNNIDFNSFDGKSSLKWFPYNKGGEKRKWYGNQEYVVNWLDEGYEIKHFKDDKGKLRSRPQNLEYYFKPSISWGLITSNGASFRYSQMGLYMILAE
jgi:hypothetical protein